MNTIIRRQRPAEADRLNRIGGRAMKDAVHGPKNGAKALGVGDRMLRYMFDGDEKSVISKVMQIIASVANPFPLLAAFKIAVQTRLIGMTDAQLAEAYREATVTETRLQAELDIRQVNRGCLEEISEMAARHAQSLERLSALAAECQRRGIDPWSQIGGRA